MKFVITLAIAMTVGVSSEASAFETETEDVSALSLICLRKQADQKVSIGFDDCRSGDVVEVEVEVKSEWPLVIVHATIADAESFEIFARVKPREIRLVPGEPRKLRLTLRTERGLPWPRRLENPTVFIRVNSSPFGHELSVAELPVWQLE